MPSNNRMSVKDARALIAESRQQSAKKSKFGNIKVEADGYIFDSKWEYEHYCELKLKQRAGLIRSLMVKQSFVVSNEIVLYGKKHKARIYIADFTYFENDTEGNSQFVVVDTKGVKTPEYILKRHLMKERNNIEIREVYRTGRHNAPRKSIRAKS